MSDPPSSLLTARRTQRSKFEGAPLLPSAPRTPSKLSAPLRGGAGVDDGGRRRALAGPDGGDTVVLQRRTTMNFGGGGLKLKTGT